MTKPKLLYSTTHWSNLSSAFLEPIWDLYFERVKIDESTTYDPAEYTVFAHSINALKWIKPWHDRGFKIIIDNTWESHSALDYTAPENSLVIKHPTWHRIVEPLWYKSLDYDKFIAERSGPYSFLMTMNLKKPHRSDVYHKLKPLLNTAIYSYYGLGIPLQNAQDIDSASPQWQRYMNPDWYNQTRFSVVVETLVSDTKNWVSEKTYKPLAFGHPFILMASPHILRSVQQQGFETFGSTVDESYDDIVAYPARLEKVCAEIQTAALDSSRFNDKQTQQKLLHNHNLFYDIPRVLEQFKKDIVDVMLEYIES